MLTPKSNNIRRIGLQSPINKMIGVLLLMALSHSTCSQTTQLEGGCSVYSYEESNIMQLRGPQCSLGIGIAMAMSDKSSLSLEIRRSLGAVNYSSSKYGDSVGQSQQVDDYRLLGNFKLDYFFYNRI